MCQKFVTACVAASVLIAALAVACGAAPPQPAERYDVVIYGGTAGGVISAIAIAQEGGRAVVVEPTGHVGGMLTGGLGWTDRGIEQTIGGLSRQFYERAYQHYQQPAAWKFESPDEFMQRSGRMVNHDERVWWAIEPSVASQLLQAMADEAGVVIHTHRRIARVETTDRRLTALVCDDGARYQAAVFIDATYEGDLLAAAGAGYHVGRESREQYNEPLAGVVPEAWSTRKQWEVDIPARDAQGQLRFGVQAEPRGPDGAGDRKVQAYNYRICLTNHPDNRLPIEKPAAYDPARYDLLALYIAARGDEVNLTGRKGHSLLKIDMLPNRKTDINDGAPFSTDYLGANWHYPEGNAAVREAILNDHLHYTQGLLYFLGHDPRVPERIRRQMLAWGYPRDEYPDHGHWTPQLYIREARRLIGEYVMTQHDIQTNTRKTDSVGMGSYNADSHHVRRIENADGYVRNEGNPNDQAVGHIAYEIPYPCLTPRRDECENLLVTFCVSASHMGFASLRMEPVFMVLSESAGLAAVHAARHTLAVQDVPIKPLQQKLELRGQRLWRK